MRRTDVAVAGTGRCSGIPIETLAVSLRDDRLVFSLEAATLGHLVEAR
jgi:hypothetical protein